IIAAFVERPADVCVHLVGPAEEKIGQSHSGIGDDGARRGAALCAASGDIKSARWRLAGESVSDVAIQRAAEFETVSSSDQIEVDVVLRIVDVTSVGLRAGRSDVSGRDRPVIQPEPRKSIRLDALQPQLGRPALSESERGSPYLH